MLNQTIKAVRHDEFDPEHLKYSTSIYKEELLIKHLTGIFNAKLAQEGGLGSRLISSMHIAFILQDRGVARI